MKTRILICIMALAVSHAWAEIQFPDFESLPEEIRKKWGYKIHRVEGSNPSISIEIPSSAATLCKAARLCIKNTEGQLLSEVNVAPWTSKDGSMQFKLNLFEGLDGYGELIIYTEHLSDLTIPLTRGGFGGFTFKLNKGFNHN